MHIFFNKVMLGSLLIDMLFKKEISTIILKNFGIFFPSKALILLCMIFSITVYDDLVLNMSALTLAGFFF